MEENKIVIYQTEDGQTQIDVRLENETVWLTQAQMAELFQKDRTVITRHINNVFKEGELEKEEVCAKFAHTTRHGAIEVAAKYDFSGGQIENIARHYTIGNILHGDSENIIEELSAYCDSERLEAKGTRKIGFCL